VWRICRSGSICYLPCEHSCVNNLGTCVHEILRKSSLQKLGLTPQIRPPGKYASKTLDFTCLICSPVFANTEAQIRLAKRAHLHTSRSLDNSQKRCFFNTVGCGH